MKKLILFILLIGCVDSYRISWDYPDDNAIFKLYVKESENKIAVLDTADFKQKYYVNAVMDTAYIYETSKDDKFVLIGVMAILNKDSSRLILSKYFDKR